MSLKGLTFLLVIIGGLNWLLVGLFSWDVGNIFGGMQAIISRIIYILVGLSALHQIFTNKAAFKG
ncbi:MAG: DUF378 domain-containing protein [Armatimonadota bacterium]|nr:DUF378 domain-containing protein [Armatimonadota bacterium]